MLACKRVFTLDWIRVEQLQGNLVKGLDFLGFEIRKYCFGHLRFGCLQDLGSSPEDQTQDKKLVKLAILTDGCESSYLTCA